MKNKSLKIKNIFIRLKKIPYFYGFILFCLFIFYVIYDVFTHPTKITIAVGKTTGAYYVYAQAYKKELAKYNVELEIVTSDGAKQIQEWVIADRVDFALVQGGLEKEGKGILALANVAHEPIWVLSRADSNISKFNDLKGKKINICNPNSGTAPVAENLLVNLLDINKSQLYYIHANKAFQKLLSGDIDVMFYIIARSSKSLQAKIEDNNISILNFEDSADSIIKYFIRDDMNLSKNSDFTKSTLKENSISFINKIPNEDKILLVKKTILVTKSASNPMVRLFLKVAQKVHSKEGLFYKEGHFLNIEALKYQQHPASKTYFEEREHHFERNKLELNFWLAQTLKEIEDFVFIIVVPLGLIGFYVEVIYPISKIMTRRRISKWYERVNILDTGMGALSLSDLKQKVLELEAIKVKIQDTDDIDSVHLESFYSLQNQIDNLINSFEKRIKGLEERQIRE
jgi:TRAP-type uncharacterized transport system substrate-binding protein